MTRHSLRQALNSLPKDLDSTYDRILGKIREEDQDAALRILQWLAYAARPLRLFEVAEVVAVDTSENPRFDVEKRLQNPWDVLAICPDLLVTLEPLSDDDDDDEEDENTFSRSTDLDDHLVEVRFAHFSVKEYLESSRIQNGDAKFFSIREIQANTAIAETCITYLLQFDQLDLLVEEELKKFPLAAYAADFWVKHMRVSENERHMALPLGLKILSSNSFALSNSVRICKRSDDFEYRPISKNDKTILDMPLYFASAHGLFYSVISILERGADVNANDGILGPALQLAAYGRQHHIVRLLLERGADPNAVGSEYGTALQAACRAGDLEIVQLLLDNGADVNAPRAGRYGSALGAAFNPIEDDDSTVCGLIRLLVRHGAHVRSAQKRRIWQYFSRDFCRELGIDDGVLDQWSEDDEEYEAFGSGDE